MNTAELINDLLSRSDGSLEQLKLHYAPLIRYVITPILSDERDREEVFWDRRPIPRTPFSGDSRPTRMCLRSSPCPTGAKTTGAMSPIPLQSVRTAGASMPGSTTSTRRPGPSTRSSLPHRSSRPWVWAVPDLSEPFRMPCSFSPGRMTRNHMTENAKTTGGNSGGFRCWKLRCPYRWNSGH